jgi:Zn-finger nucleic acid-binding protein
VRLTCPQCAAQMNEVKAPATTGYWLLLDQCPGCGGIWCDRWELYPLTATAAQQLDRVDPAALSKPAASAGAPLICPRCRARLAPFHDRALPADARIERCPNCEGIWLNRGELRRLKNRGATAALRHPVADAAEINRLTRAVGDAQSWPTVHDLDTAMNPAPESEPAEDLRPELMKGAAWLILRAALRLLLHV